MLVIRERLLTVVVAEGDDSAREVLAAGRRQVQVVVCADERIKAREYAEYV